MKNLKIYPPYDGQNQPPPPGKIRRAFNYVAWKALRFVGYWRFKKGRNKGET